MSNNNNNNNNSEPTEKQQQNTPSSMAELDHRRDSAWLVSFGAAMIPFTSFLYFHSKGGTGRVVEAVVRSPVGVYGLLALPFVSLALEKCVYDTAQAAQGIDPTVVPANRGGFPSGGGAALPSLSLIPVQPKDKLPGWLSHKSVGVDNSNVETTASLLRRRTADHK